MGPMATLPRTEHRVARSLAETADPREALARALPRSARGSAGDWARPGSRRRRGPRRSLRGDVARARAWTTRTFVERPRGLTLVARRGAARPRVGQRGAGLDRGRRARRELPARARPRARRACAPAFCFPLRSARGVLGVVEFFTGEPREPDAELLATMATLGDQIGQAVERRRDAERAARERGAPAGDARRRARLRGHDGPRAAGSLEFNPAAERTFGYSADGGGRARDGRADRAARAARAAPRAGSRATSRPARPRCSTAGIEITGDARRRQRVPGRADDHADRRARPADVHRLPARHHRAQGRPRRSCARRARGSSRRPTRRAGGSSATSTTARSSGWSSWRSTLRLARAQLDDATRRRRAELLDDASTTLADGDRRAARARARDPSGGR